MTTKPPEGHVLFWITEEDGREFATCGASEFRAAMRERDELRAEVEAAQRSAREMHVAADQFARERDELRDDNESLRLAGGKLEELTTRLQAELSETEQALATSDSENERLHELAADAFGQGQVSGLQAPAAQIRELQAEVERLRADQRYLDESVRNQAIRETIHKEELNRLRAALRMERADTHENERLRAALLKHHDLLSDEPGDLCTECGLDWNAC